MTQTIGRWITNLGAASAHPGAFLILIGFTATWLVFQPDTFDWHGVATIATWTMTLFIQRSEYRDTQAIQAKLDELLRATTNARDDLSSLDDRDAEEIKGHRARAQAFT